MPHHPCLAERKGDKYPDDVELDEPAGRGVETPDQQPRQYRQDDDAVAEDQSITAAAELAGQVSVPPRIEARIGKPLKAVFAASTRMAAVNACTRKKNTEW